MASERQIAANRVNASKSTGPRSNTGKRRSSSNSLRHGLSRRVGGNAELDLLAREFVEDECDAGSLELARTMVRAHLDLLRIREIKQDLKQRMYTHGSLHPLRRFRSVSAEINYILKARLDRPLHLPPSSDGLSALSFLDEERTAEAMRRLLPELARLERYERRAFNAKHKALRKLADYRLRNAALSADTGSQNFCEGGEQRELANSSP
jgi:hypothetical protein